MNKEDLYNIEILNLIIEKLSTKQGPKIIEQLELTKNKRIEILEKVNIERNKKIDEIFK